MKTLSFCIVFTVVSLSNSESRANGFLQKLPKDGSWVRYHGSSKLEKPDNSEVFVTFIIRFVGREMVEGEPCRWLEYELSVKKNDKNNKSIFKMLVPEKLLKGDKSTSKKVIRGWIKNNDKDPQKLEDLEDFSIYQITGFLPDPSRKIKKINQKKTVFYQKGSLKIDSAITWSEKKTPPINSNDKIVNTSTVTIWSHDEVPIGTAEARFELEGKEDNQVLIKGTSTFTLEDFGTGAKSALPNYN